MKRQRLKKEQIISVLRRADVGKKPEELTREYGMAVGTFYASKAKFGGKNVSEARRRKALEDENRRLKTLVADQALDNAILGSVAEKKLSTCERRREVSRVQSDFGVSERRTCHLLDQPRRSHRYIVRIDSLEPLRAAIREHAYATLRDS